MSVSDAAAATRLPDSTEPVIATMSTSAWRTIASPVAPAPTTTFRTPSGRMSAAISASLSVVSGVVSAGLMTIVLPPASAGPSFQIAIISG